MKTKKISWQAIAIVVLALVLIASIALGVSGAWFQDSDKEETNLTLGHAVTIRLADTTENSNRPKIWSATYSGDAYPGDLVFGATSIVPGEAYGEPTKDKVSAAVYRIKIKATASGNGYVPSQTTAPAALGEGASAEEKKTWNQQNNSYLINQMLANATDDTFKGSWTQGKTADLDELKWYYYNSVNQSSTPIDIFKELRLSNQITNEAAGWTISVTVTVEAIQAANIMEEGALGNADWRDDMPGDNNTGLKSEVLKYNAQGTGRLQ